MNYPYVTLGTLLACTLASNIASADSDRIYLEENGIILFEVEDAEAVEGWQLSSDVEGFKGNGYFEWTGPNRFPKSSAGVGNITYHFRIQTAGNYQLRWRSHIVVGENNTEHNDSWVRLLTGENIVDQHPLDGWTKNYMNTLDEWSWTSKTVDHVGESIKQYFAQGDHTVEISGRSIGHAIDRIALYLYEEVDGSNRALNSWDLSRMLMEDGSIVDPTDENNQSNEEEEETDPPTETSRENLVVAEGSLEAHANNQCIDNTLALTASAFATFNPAEADTDYTTADSLTINAEDSSALLKFDMSLVPPSDTIVLEYTTADEASDGAIVYSLASHSDWEIDSLENVQHPDAMLELDQAVGGWEAATRYQSELPAALLATGFNTIMINSQTGSDPLKFDNQDPALNMPRLLLTGDDSFCETWQANVDAHNAPVEPPEEEQTEQPVAVLEPAPEQPESESGNTQNTNSSGGALSWLAMFTLALIFGNRRLKTRVHNRHI